MLAAAEVSPADLAAARATWQSWIRAAVVGVLGLTILLCAAPLLEARRHARRPGAFVLTTGSLVACLAIGRTLLRAAFLPVVGGSIAGPAELLPDALLLTALVWLAIDTIEQRRVSRPSAHLIANDRVATLVTVAAFSAAGAVAAAGLWAYERVLGGIASQAAQDLVSFSLHPFEAGRLGIAAALVLLHAAVVWGAAGILRLPAVLWRTSRRQRRRQLAALAAAVGAGVVLLFVATGTARRPAWSACPDRGRRRPGRSAAVPSTGGRRAGHHRLRGWDCSSSGWLCPRLPCIPRSMRSRRLRRNGSSSRNSRHRWPASAKTCRCVACRRRSRRLMRRPRCRSS